MTSLDEGQLTGIAIIPVLSPLGVPVYLMVLLATSLLVYYLARVVMRESSEIDLRRLRILTLAQAAAAALRLAEVALGWNSWQILTALHSLLDLAVLALVLSEIRLLVKRQLAPRGPYAALIGLALVGVFCALLGGDTGQPFLSRNLCSALGQIAIFLWLAAVLLHILLFRMREKGRQLQTDRDALRAGKQRLQERGERLRSELESRNEQLTQLKEKADRRLIRHRKLEQLLTVSVNISARRSLVEVNEHLVAAVAEILGFEQVILYLHSDNTQAFEARAFAGVPEEDKASLTGTPVSADLFAELTNPCYRYSNCFLITDLAAESDDDEPLVKPSVVSREWRDGFSLIAPLVSPTGETRGYLTVDGPRDGVVPNMVDVRQLEFLVRQATVTIETAEVHDRLAENNRELALASDKLGSLADMKANFVANVSHELRTPLTSISAYTELLQQNTETMTEEMRREFLRVINRESDKLTQIIEDILELNRMEDGKAHVDRVSSDLVALASHLDASWRARAEEQEITFTFSTASKQIDLDVDPLLIQQLLGHLLGNAFKFTPAGGEIRLALTERGSAVEIVVEDSGIGIPEQQLDAIFEQFYQVDGSATREHSGQGVGLAICHDIVSYHDGRIWAENVSPQGARFTVVLPRRPAVLQPIAVVRQGQTQADTVQFMQRMMHWISESIGVQLATLMMPDSDGDFMTIRAAIGLPEAVVQGSRVRRGAGFVGKVWVTGRTLLIDDFTVDPRFIGSESVPRYSTPSVLCVPLVHDLEVIGVVTVNNRKDDRPLREDDRMLLEAMAPRITYLLRKYLLHEAAVQDFAAIQESLRAATTVGYLVDDHITSLCHEICLATARRINLPQDQLEHLAFALHYYDVGMSCVPTHLMQRVEPLNPEERQEIARHVSAGLAILAPLQPSAKVRQIILHHHENFDGSGYPDGLSGEAIPLGARLLRLTDSLSAALQTRPYRPARSLDSALVDIRCRVNEWYCPRLTEVFLSEAERRRDLFSTHEVEVPVTASTI